MAFSRNLKQELKRFVFYLFNVSLVHIFEQIRHIINTLKNNKLDYIDITGYNFIIDEDHKIHIIDFEHSIDRTIHTNINDGQSWFLNTFLDGINIWNPDFE